MRILVHDFGGYPFPAELSRSFADRGHEVLHSYCAALSTNPGGSFASDDTRPTLAFEPITLGEPIAKYSFVKRLFQERRYGRLSSEQIRKFAPEIVLSANMPLDAQTKIQSTCRSLDIPMVFWLQDVLGVAADKLLRKKIPLLGGMIGAHYLRMEAKLLRRSQGVVCITDDFLPLMDRWKVDRLRVTTIENWAPLSQFPELPKSNDWSRRQSLEDKFVFLYAGTMGMKHNPTLIAQVAEATRHLPDVRVVVISQGPGAEFLKAFAKENSLENLVILPYGPLADVPKTFAASDVLLAVLQSDAGAYSVPSKVLAYLCGGKPLSTAMPTENLASRILHEHEAGLVCNPNDIDSFVESALRLYNDESLRHRMGRNARQYAEDHFSIEKITDRFETVFDEVVSA